MSAPGATTAPRVTGFTPTDALLALMTLIWGVNVIIVKAALTVFSPLEFNALRFALAGVVITLVARRYGRGVPTAEDRRRLVLLGIFGIFIYQIAFIEGLAHTRAGNASLIMGTSPVFTAMLSHLHGHERLRSRDVAGLLISVFGVASVILGSAQEVGFRDGLVGDVLMLAATILWAIYTVGAKPLLDRLGHITTTAWTMAIGAVPVVLLGAPALLRHDLATVHPAAWGAVLFSSLGAVVLAFLLWYRGVEKLGSTRTATYSNFQPVIVLLIAWPLLHETPTLWQVAGAGGIFTSIYLTRS